jgi:hypothetical protein
MAQLAGDEDYVGASSDQQGRERVAEIVPADGLDAKITLGVYAHLFDGDEQAQRTREMLQQMLGSAVSRGPLPQPDRA